MRSQPDLKLIASPVLANEKVTLLVIHPDGNSLPLMDNAVCMDMDMQPILPANGKQRLNLLPGLDAIQDEPVIEKLDLVPYLNAPADTVLIQRVGKAVEVKRGLGLTF